MEKHTDQVRKDAMRFQGAHGLEMMSKWLATGDLQELRAVTFIDTPKADISWIGSATNLTNLTISGSASFEIDLSKLANLSQLKVKQQPASKIIGLEKLDNLWQLECLSWCAEDLARMAGCATMVDIFGPPETLLSFEQTTKMERLRIIRASKHPVNVGALADLAKVKWLEFESITKGVYGASQLQSLGSLETLIIDAAIDNLDWVPRLPRLKEFWVSPKNLSGSDIENVLFIKNIYASGNRHAR
jgi:Leucine-rich repeat (LRR) protein